MITTTTILPYVLSEFQSFKQKLHFVNQEKTIQNESKV
jgi:hypothetical protein